MQRSDRLLIACDDEHPCKGWDLETLRSMLAEGELLDLELRSRAQDGTWIALRVHSLIMALVSPVLRRMILWEGSRGAGEGAGAAGCSKCKVLELEEVHSSVVEAFIEFVYKGFVHISPQIENLLALGKLADRLDVVSLRRAVLAQTQQLLTVHTCAIFLQASHFSGLPELEERVFHFALERFVEVSVYPSFHRLDQVVLENLVADDRLSVPNEEAVLVALMQWRLGRAAEGLDVQAEGWERLLNCVRFAMISPSFLESGEAVLAEQINCSELRKRLYARTAACANGGSEAYPAQEAAWETRSSEVHMIDKSLDVIPAERGALQMPRGGSGPGQDWCSRVKMAMELKLHSGAVEAVTYYRGAVISASRDGCIKLCSAHTGRVDQVLAADPRTRGAGVAEHDPEHLPFVGAVYALLVHGEKLFSGSQNKELGPLNVWCLKVIRLPDDARRAPVARCV